MLRTEAFEPVGSPEGRSACGDEEQAAVSRVMPIAPISLGFMRRLRIGDDRNISRRASLTDVTCWLRL